MTHSPMTLPDLVIARQGFPYSHTSSFAMLDDGRLLHSSCGIANYSEDGGLTWSKQYELKDADGKAMLSSAAVRLSGRNAVGVVGGTDQAHGQRDRGMGKGVGFYRSEDGGQTWSKPSVVLPSHPMMSVNCLHDTAVRTSSGRIIVTGYITTRQKPGTVGDPMWPHSGKLIKNQYVPTGAHDYDPGFWGCWVSYSDDDGRTWQQPDGGFIFILLDWNTLYASAAEPTMTQVAPGHLLMVIRTGLGRLFQARSQDNGETWTRAQPTQLAACNSPAQVRTLPNGHLLCVWNQAGTEEIHRGYTRSRLSSAISRNGGYIWEFFQNIESIHDTARVVPGPIEPTRPQEIYLGEADNITCLHDHPTTELPLDSIDHAESQQRFHYPSVFVLEDRVIVTYQYFGEYEEDPVKAQLKSAGTGMIDPETGLGCFQIRKILPLKWFYGGKEPADNPYIRKIERSLPTKT